jgi:hypothetical protein
MVRAAAADSVCKTEGKNTCENKYSAGKICATVPLREIHAIIHKEIPNLPPR